MRRLLDAALEVMAREGTRARARVADIVSAAGLSNDAFYRHFPSKEALVVALLEDGTARLVGYIGHQMDKESTPEGQVRRWAEAILSQTNEETAGTMLAVLYNGSSVGAGLNPGRHDPAGPIGALLHQPFRALGDPDPEVDASLVTHAVLGNVADHLWSASRPSRKEVEHIIQFCVEAARR